MKTLSRTICFSHGFTQITRIMCESVKSVAEHFKGEIFLLFDLYRS